MPDYSKNFLTSMTGYVNMNDPVEPEPKSYMSPAKTSLDTTADVRDILSNIVGNGYRDWQEFSSNENAKSHYGTLINRVGRPLATKLVTQAIVFNQRPDMKNAALESRIQSFYDIGSSDKQVSDVLSNVKSSGYGVLPGFRESSLHGNQELSGRLKKGTDINTEQAEKVKQVISQNRK
jgi:hypothetical protein